MYPYALDLVSREQWYSTEEAIKTFGEPGVAVESQLITFDAPYRMRLYERGSNVIVTKIRCHDDIAKYAHAALALVEERYREQERIKYGLDVYAGCYNHRKGRGSSSWSKHAFGIAFDFLPAENGFRTPWDESTFSRPEYIPWLDAWRECGFANLGRRTGFERDAMHFEFLKAPVI